MNNKKVDELIKSGRNFMQLFDYDNIDEPSDQQLGKAQPPLYKAALSDNIIKLSKNFKDLKLKSDFLEILYKRKSHRNYTKVPLTLLELSYLCWAQSGVKKVLGDNYCTIRPVACGGARHEFELYIAVLNVKGLIPGAYHYLPENHSLELLYEVNDLSEFKNNIVSSLFEQSWVKNAGVIFYYSIIPYRAEWRYSYRSHRVALIDSGHITQNLYLACTAASLGTCAIAALDPKHSNTIFNLDGKDEFMFYAASSGHVPECSKEENDEYNNFLTE